MVSQNYSTAVESLVATIWIGSSKTEDAILRKRHFGISNNDDFVILLEVSKNGTTWAQDSQVSMFKNDWSTTSIQRRCDMSSAGRILSPANVLKTKRTKSWNPTYIHTYLKICLMKGGNTQTHTYPITCSNLKPHEIRRSNLIRRPFSEVPWVFSNVSSGRWTAYTHPSMGWQQDRENPSPGVHTIQAVAPSKAMPAPATAYKYNTWCIILSVCQFKE